MEAPIFGQEDGLLWSRTIFFQVRIVCHERIPYTHTYSGCKEHTWCIKRRFMDFEELFTALRSDEVLPPSVKAPRKTLIRHLIPTEEFAQQRAGELLQCLAAALDAADKRAQAEPARFRDCVDVNEALPKFLGLEEQPVAACDKARFGGPARAWAMPSGAEEYPAALVYSMDRGTYIWGKHHDVRNETGGRFNGSRITRFSKVANLGDLVATHAEVRRLPAERRCPSAAKRRLSDAPMSPASGGIREPVAEHKRLISQGSFSTVSSGVSGASPRMGASPDHSRWPTPTPSTWSTPSSSILPSPAQSPPLSRCATPTRQRSCVLSDDGSSYISTSTVDSDYAQMQITEMPSEKQSQAKAPTLPAVWLEVDTHNEWQRDQDHRRWWSSVLAQRQFGDAGIRGASRVDAAAAAFRSSQDANLARRRVTEELEQTAALYCELSALHEELHPILGYGVDGRTFVVVLQASPSSQGIRTLPFSQTRCYRVLGQVLKALQHLHGQNVQHGWLTPESLVIDEGPLGTQARLAWTPGQKRTEGHVSAMIGYRAPGPASVSGDMWSLACVMLVWWNGFSPSPHPWTQFARSKRITHDIHEALSETPPALPKAFLDLHAAAASAEEPMHTFLSLLAHLLTGCFAWDRSERPSAMELQQHRFFEQSL